MIKDLFQINEPYDVTRLILIIAIIVFLFVTIYVYIKERDIGDAIAAGWISAVIASFGLFGLFFVGSFIYWLFI